MALLPAHSSMYQDAVYLLAGDESPVSKSGKQTHGVDWFFSSILRQSHSRSGFFLDSAHRREEETSLFALAPSRSFAPQKRRSKPKNAKSYARQRSQKPGPKRPRGRPKGSKNKNKAEVTLSPELSRILAQAQKVLALIGNKIRVAYFVLDGHFGNHLRLLDGAAVGFAYHLQDAPQCRTLSAAHCRREGQAPQAQVRSQDRLRSPARGAAVFEHHRRRLSHRGVSGDVSA